MKFILAIFLLLTITGTAQETPGDCSYKIDKIGNGKFQVKVKDFDSLNNSESCFLGWMNSGKGKPDGELVVLDENGKKRRLAIYKGGIRVGTHYEWYSTGELYSVTTWETDMYFNTKAYYKSGKLYHTSVNGNRDNAVYTSYYENGKVESVTNYSTHIEKTYYDNGQIKTDKSDAKKIYTEWHKNGKVKLTGSLDDGAWGRIGKWSYYDEKGKLIRELIYETNNSSWYGAEEGFSKEINY